MFQSVRTVVVAACVSALVAGAVVGTHAAFGSDGSNQPPATPGSGDVSASFQVAGRVAEMSYVPIAPCTLVDTARAGGRFASGATRNYDARGTTSLAGQGGNVNGCTIPENAAVLALTVRAVESVNAGSVRIGPGSGSIAVNYRANQITTGFTNVDLAAPTQPKDFKVQNAGGPTHMVIGTIGYYIAPMGAVVSANGTATLGSRLVSAARLAPGAYEAIFDRDVSRCFYSVTPRDFGVIPSAIPRADNVNGVYIAIANTAGTAVDHPFSLTVEC